MPYAFHLIVTRHPALVQYLSEIGLCDPKTPVVTHVTDVAEVNEKDVLGVLPLHLAAYCNSVTEVPLAIPADMRGKELTVEDLRKYAGKPVTYNVTRVMGLDTKVA